jgi:hypothetical protein
MLVLLYSKLEPHCGAPIALLKQTPQELKPTNYAHYLVVGQLIITPPTSRT